MHLTQLGVRRIADRVNLDSGAARWAGLALVLIAVAFNAVFLAPELRIGRLPLNDNVLHLTASERLAESFRRGEPFLDPWVSEWSLGYPLWRSYQPLPHLLAAVVIRIGAAAHLDAASAFAALTYALLVSFPASVYAGARLLGFSAPAAGLAAIFSLAPSGSGELGRYGIGYGATVWRGSGLYTQLVALVLLTPALGLTARALDSGRRRGWAALLLALTALSHLLIGYVAFVSGAFLAVVGPSRGRSARVLRWLVVSALAAALLLWFAVPLLLGAGEVNHSRWEPPYKWDSFGAALILGELISGRLLDAGRFPILSLFLGIGSIGAALALRRGVPGRLLALGALWLLLFFGRATWGHLLFLAAIPSDFHLHRLQAAFEISAVLLAAWGLAHQLSAAKSRSPRLAILAAAAVALGVVGMGIERARYLRENTAWGEENLRAYARHGTDLERALASVDEILSERPGRVSAGRSGGWGGGFTVGSVPVYAFLSRRHIDQVSFLYHAMSLTSDVMVLAEESRPSDNDVFGIRAVLAPAELAMADHLRLRARHGRFAVYEASGDGYFSLVDLGGRYAGDPESRYEPNSAWLRSPLASAGIVLALDSRLESEHLPALSRWTPLPSVDPQLLRPRGAVLEERKEGETYYARVRSERPTHVLVKLTWSPDLVATVDGSPAPILRVTPGFGAISVTPGMHEVALRYAPGRLKPLLLALGALAFAIGAWALGRPAVRRLETRCTGGLSRLANRFAGRRAAALVAVALLTGLAVRPLFRGQLVDGHDALAYPPRLVEMHRAIADLHLPPIWAPDLGNGYGQPLFQFAPPLLYIVALPLYAARLSLTDSIQMGLACLCLVGAAAMYRLARRYGCSRHAGVATAALWLFAPYLALDLFVRAAFAEAAALAVAPLALLGALAAVDRPSAWSAAKGAFAVALILLAHNAVSLLFIPALVAAVVGAAAGRDRPALRLAGGGASVLGGLGLSAYFWLPALLEKHHVKIELLRQHLLHWTQHALQPAQLLWSDWGYGLSVPGPEDAMSFALGPIHLGLGGAGLVLALRRNRSAEACAFAVIALAGSLLATSWSAPLWSRIPTVQYLVYPGRALFLPALFLPLLAAFTFDRLRPTATTLLVAAVLIVNLPHTAVKGFLAFDDEYYAPESIARKGINTTTREEYEPRWVEARPAYAEQDLAGPLTVRKSSIGTARREYHVTATSAGVVEVSTFYYPGWVARIDGKEVPIEPVAGRGTISFRIDPGQHVIELAFEQTPLRLVALAITVATAFTVIGAGIIARPPRA